MDKKNINIDKIKDVLVTQDVRTNKSKKSIGVKNYFFTEKLSDKTMNKGLYLDLRFNIVDINLQVDNSYFKSLNPNDVMDVMKNWKFDMYFEYENEIYHAPIYKLGHTKAGFRVNLFVGVITPLNIQNHSMEFNNYLHTIEKMLPN